MDDNIDSSSSGSGGKNGSSDSGGVSDMSASRRRARNALAWVDASIEQLVEVIQRHGVVNLDSGEVEIQFGQLFRIYEDVSSSLMGILMRAKKRSIVKYRGHMLYQNSHDEVVVSLVPAADR